MKQIIITCDTEVGELAAGANAVEVFMEGKVQNKVAGISLINSIVSQYKATVEHFVDVYPYERYGEGKFRRVCNQILQQGHHVQLHTHPSGKFDGSRRYMHQYTLDEQLQIIEWGKSKIREWTGYDVIAHRAGGYGANDLSLEAIHQNGITIDSSFFYKNPICQIQYPHINRSTHYKNIFQIPVTVYQCEKQFFPFYKMIDYQQKLDYRYGSSVEDIVTFVRSAPENCIITLFLHSFNFLTLRFDIKRRTYNKILVNQNLIEDLEKLLSTLLLIPSVRFTSFREIDTRVPSGEVVIKIHKKEFSGKRLLQKIARKFSGTIDV
jgi:hypothetical protein